MNRFYLDTEFNGHRGSLISLALVEDNGCREWYEVMPIGSETDFCPWVWQHVIPVLRSRWIPTADFRTLFKSFVGRLSDPEIICDWHADAAFFCELLSGDDYQSSLDFPFRITILKTPPDQPVSRLPHNALEDARALRDWHMALADPS